MIKFGLAKGVFNQLADDVLWQEAWSKRKKLSWAFVSVALHLEQRNGLLLLAIAHLQEYAFNPAKYLFRPSIDLGRFSIEGFMENKQND